MIDWISVNTLLPTTYEDKDEDGIIHKRSYPVLVWDGSDDEPIAIGVYEDGKWYAFGIAQYGITHWATLYDPNGNIIKGDFRGGW